MRVHFFYMFLSIVATANTDSSNAFVVKPQATPYLIHDRSDSLTLPCVLQKQYFDRSKFEMNWAQYNNGHLRIITKNSKILVKKNGMFTLTDDSISGNYSLTLHNIQKKNVEGTYYCNIIAIDDDLQFSSAAEVIVLVPPGDPTIDLSPSDSVNENDFLTATCSSAGGSPRPEFEWILPNNTTANASTLSTFFKDGVTESFLRYQVHSEDNNHYIQCKVKNAAMSGTVAKEMSSSRLKVNFKPRIYILPSENATHLTVEEGSSVNLTCSGTSNPPIHSFEWKHQLMGRYQGRTLQFIANSSTNGDIECIATNSIGESKTKIELVVQHAPKVKVPNVINPNETEDVKLDCNVDSYPKVHDIKWIGPNNFKQNGSRLILKAVTGFDAGNYTCVATNFLTLYGLSGSQQRTSTGTTFIDVRRKPGKATIDKVHSVDLGSTIYLKCKIFDAGNPHSSYLWATPASGNLFGLDGNNESLMVIKNAQLSDNGIYSCKAFNEIGEGPSDSTEITVIEPPQISSPLATEFIFTVGQQNTSLTCEAQGYPPPKITWKKNERTLNNTDYEIGTEFSSACEDNDFCTRTVRSKITLRRNLKWFDKGNFTCSADNGSNKTLKSATSWSILRVLHKPVIVKPNYMDKLLSAVEPGFQANLECVASGRPKPSFRWIFKDINILENYKYSWSTYSSFENPDEYKQVLQIKNVTQSDYGDYTCIATNAHGEDSVLIELQKTQPPSQPVEFQKKSTSVDSIIFNWIPQFDGGSNQSFIIEIKKMDPFTGDVENNAREEIINEIDHGKELEYQEDGRMKTTIEYSITGLEPCSTYVTRLKSRNAEGESEFTMPIVATTADVFEVSSIMPPKTLNFDHRKNKFHVEPQPPEDACVLLYVFTNGVWRSTQCQKVFEPLTQDFYGKNYKARFCTTMDLFKCSGNSNEISIGSTQTWKHDSIVILFSFALIIGFCVCLLRIYYRNQKRMQLRELSSMVVFPFSEKQNKSASSKSKQSIDVCPEGLLQPNSDFCVRNNKEIIIKTDYQSSPTLERSPQNEQNYDMIQTNGKNEGTTFCEQPQSPDHDKKRVLQEIIV